MIVAVRAVVYAAVFVGVVLIFVPARVLSWSGITRPPMVGAPQLAGMVVGAVGATLVAWCVTTFAVVGRGTPAPFDPPRRLVVRGPYGFVRNPMYIGGGLALAGAASFYQSASLLGYMALFFVTAHLFVISYEEPTLKQTFGVEYEAYCRQVRRWWPRFRSPRS